MFAFYHFSHWCLSAFDLHMDVSPISIVHDLSQEACHVNMRPHEAPSQEDYIKQTLQGATGHWASLNPRGNTSPARRSKVSSPAIWGHHDTQTMLSGDEDLKWHSIDVSMIFPWMFPWILLVKVETSQKENSNKSTVMTVTSCPVCDPVLKHVGYHFSEHSTGCTTMHLCGYTPQISIFVTQGLLLHAPSLDLNKI